MPHDTAVSYVTDHAQPSPADLFIYSTGRTVRLPIHHEAIYTAELNKMLTASTPLSPSACNGKHGTSGRPRTTPLEEGVCSPEAVRSASGRQMRLRF